MVYLSSYSVYDFFNNIAPEVYASVIVTLLICIFAVVMGHFAKKSNPLEKPSLIVWFGEWIVESISNFVESTIGPKLKTVAPYVCVLAMYLPVALMAGLLGLPSPTTYWGVPLVFATITFLGIHGTAIKFQGFKNWSKRFVEPIFVFLPINILTLPSTIISLSFRMFGNALAGSIIMTVCYWGCSLLSEALFSLVNLDLTFNFSSLLITPVLHGYFDVFSGYIQSLVFIYLSCQFVAQEIPDDDELELQNT